VMRGDTHHGVRSTSDQPISHHSNIAESKVPSFERIVTSRETIVTFFEIYVTAFLFDDL